MSFVDSYYANLTVEKQMLFLDLEKNDSLHMSIWALIKLAYTSGSTNICEGIMGLT